MKIYCPACGEWSERVNLDFSPSAFFNWQCPECDTGFKIKIEYEMIEDEPNASSPTPSQSKSPQR